MKPKIEKFREVADKVGGNITKVAKAFNVSRAQVYVWMGDDEKFKSVIDDARGALFDDCLSTARVLALGIPDVQNGKVVGWIERPDSFMVRYLLGTLGRKEGFGENIDITTNGKDVNGVNLFRVLTPDEIKNFKQTFDEEY